MDKKLKNWLEHKVQEYVDNDIKAWRDLLVGGWTENAPSDATQEDFDDFCSDLEDSEMEYKSEREDYWREELHKNLVDLGILKLTD